MKTVVALFFMLSVGCSTSLMSRLDHVSPGMDKADILELNGSPWITRRKNSKDLWVYRYYSGDQEYHRQLTFENGKVIAITPPRKHPKETRGLEETESFQQYQKAVKAKKKDYKDGFKAISETDDDT